MQPLKPKTSLERLEETIPLIERALARREGRERTAREATGNFRSFVPLAWDTVEPARGFVANWHIDAIAEHLQAVADGQIRNLLINVPAGHAKSLLVSVLWPAWMWVRNPRWRSIFSSYAADLAVRDSVRCRGLIQSAWYKDTFRIPWQLSGDQNVKSYFENTEKGSRFSTSVGARGTGFRGDCIVVDDPLNAKDQFSDAAIEECILWWDNVMSSRLNDMQTGAKVIIMQRLSDRDLSGHVLERGGYEHLCLPTEFEPDRRSTTVIGFCDPRTHHGELLFEAMFPQAVVEQAKKDLGASSFAGQHQQRPSPADGGMIKKHWWRYWQPRGVRLPPVPVKLPNGNVEYREAITLPDRFDMVLQSWDMAFKDSKRADFVAGLVLAAAGADRYVLDSEHDRMDLPETLVAVRRLSVRWPNAHLKLVEDRANGPAVIQSLRHEIGGLVEVQPEGGKASRAAAAAPALESGNWFLPHPVLAPWVEPFIAELAAFPAGANDDWTDAWSQGSKRLLHIAPRKPIPESPYPSRRTTGDRDWMV